jgi:hypothetical protein
MNRYLPIGNTTTENMLSGNTFDLVYQTITPNSEQNCFAANTFTTSLPASIETLMPCGGSSTLSSGSQITLPVAPDGPAYKDVAIPGPQKTMASPRTAPPRPMIGPPPYPVLSSLEAPDAP